MDKNAKTLMRVGISYAEFLIKYAKNLCKSLIIKFAFRHKNVVHLVNILKSNLKQTKMKTKTDFLNNYSSNPELAKKTLNAGGLTWDEIKKMGWDAYAANTGSVPGMIYYNDTVRFAKKNVILILNALNKFEAECGLLTNKPTDDETQYFNWLAWFAWENTMNEVLNYLETD